MRMWARIVSWPDSYGFGTIRYFQNIQSFELTQSMDTLTDVCTITFAHNAFKEGKKISDYLYIGERITLEAGYWPDNWEAVFDGFVSKIEPGAPAKITVEDWGWKYKQEYTAEKGAIYRNTTLKQLLNHLPGYYVADDIEIGTWQVAATSTPIDVLRELKNKFGMILYYQNPYYTNKFGGLSTIANSSFGLLWADAELIKPEQRTILFDVQRNVPDGTVKLESTTTSSVRPVVHGVSVQNDKSKIELYAYYDGDKIIVTGTRPNGTLNKFSVPNISQASLEKLVRRRLPNLFYTGVSGEISTFGAPFIQHGMKAAVYDRRLADFNGIYKIVEVKKTYSPESGFKQTASLGRKLGDYDPTGG